VDAETLDPDVELPVILALDVSRSGKNTNPLGIYLGNIWTQKIILRKKRSQAAV